jgi:hypothetical protein
MARSLKNKPGVSEPTSTYPFGRAKDDSLLGLNDGYQVNEQGHGDMLQFFECLLKEANITPNEIADNEYDGFQYISALKTLINSINGGLRRKIVEIGNWDMTATTFVDIPHEISDFKKIRGVSAIIRNDADTTHYPIARFDTVTEAVIAGISSITSTYIELNRKNGSPFDNGAFDSVGGYNRGWVIIDYLP